MSRHKFGRIAAAAAAVGAIVIGGAVFANAATGTPSPGAVGNSQAADSGKDGPGQGRGGGGHGGNHTAVTGDELAKVTAAVKAKDAAVAVSEVRKDPDGSYDVFGTKSGAQVMFEVSADLKTITQNTGGPGQGHGGPGKGQGGPGQSQGGGAAPGSGTATPSGTVN